MSLCNRSYLAVLVLLSFGFSGVTRATVLMENLFGSAPINSAVLSGANLLAIGQTYWGAVGMNTGTNAYNFDRMNIFILSNNLQNMQINGGIYSDSAGSPGSLVQAFNPVIVPPVSSSLPQSWIFTTPVPTTLAAGTNYWFVVNGINTPASYQPFAYFWTGATNFQPTTNYDGTSDLGFSASTFGGSGWAPPSPAKPGMIIEGTAVIVPEPAAGLTILAVFAGLRRRARMGD
jgi:hypothetical protein